MSVIDTLLQLPTVYRGGPDVDKTLQFDISRPVYATIKDGVCTVTEGQAAAPNITLRLSDDDLVQLLTGKLDGMTAVMTGKLKLSGYMLLATQIPRWFDRSALV